VIFAPPELLNQKILSVTIKRHTNQSPAKVDLRTSIVNLSAHQALHVQRLSPPPPKNLEPTYWMLTDYALELTPSLNPTLTPSTLSTMSAPKAGRQSPERQTESQIKEPGSGNIGAAESEHQAKDESDDSVLNKLPSNPEGPMEGAAHEKVSKEGRGDV